MCQLTKTRKILLVVLEVEKPKTEILAVDKRGHNTAQAGDAEGDNVLESEVLGASQGS